jgi:hypothetical protein
MDVEGNCCHQHLLLTLDGVWFGKAMNYYRWAKLKIQTSTGFDFRLGRCFE